MDSNIKSFVELIEKYKQITPEDITYVVTRYGFGLDSRETMRLLTGYGSMDTCSLCVEAADLKRRDPEAEFYMNNTCDYCVYVQRTQAECYAFPNNITYNNIAFVLPNELPQAIKDRVRYMEYLLGGDNEEAH